MAKRIVVVLALILPLFALMFGCSKKGGPSLPVPNKKPHVELTGRPFGVASYSYSFYWTAWDDDGEVRKTIYAISRPVPSESLQTVLPTLNWIEAGGWKQSVAFSADTLFGFSESPGSPPDTSSHVGYKAEFRRMHLFVVRVIDDRGDTSAVDQNSYVAFNASNIAPKSWITMPAATINQVAIIGKMLNVQWKGLDDDATTITKLPVKYRYRLMQVTSHIGNASDELAANPYWLDGPETAESRWIEVSPETTSLSLELSGENDYYLFGVRAIDEAGAVEPLLIRAKGNVEDSQLFRGNVILVKSRLGAGLPYLTVCEASLGCQTVYSYGEWVVEISSGQQLSFNWSGDASAYGGKIIGYNYALDPVELDPEADPDKWSGWGSYTALPRPLVIRTPGTHYFYVKVRDNGNNETTARVEIRVHAYTADREMLLIDDFRDLELDFWKDADHDAFWDRVLDRNLLKTRYGIDSLYVHEVFMRNPNTGSEVQNLSTISLTELLRYKVVIWYTFPRNIAAGGTFLGTAAIGTDSYPPSFASYLIAGGSLWLSGSGIYAQLGGLTIYPLTIGRGNIAFDHILSNYRNIQNLAVQKSGSTAYNDQKRHGLVSAVPFTSKKAGAPRPYPPMTVDPTKWSYLEKYGMGLADGEVIMPADPANPSTFLKQPGLDTLYLFGPKSVQSNLKTLPLAIRMENGPYSQTEMRRASTTKYRVVVTPFILYYFPENQVQNLAVRILDWFILNRS